MKVQVGKHFKVVLLILLSIFIRTLTNETNTNTDSTENNQDQQDTNTGQNNTENSTNSTDSTKDNETDQTISQSESNENCGVGCLSCSPLDYCLICDSSKLLFLKTTFHPTLPFPHLKTVCQKIDFPHCAKIDVNGNCLFCKEGFFIREGECVEATLKVPGCLKQIDEDVCRQCLDNYYLDSPQSCLVTDPKTDAGNGCKFSRKDKTKCFECEEGFVMNDLGKCIAEIDIAPLINKGNSTLMYPQLTDFSHCQLASRFECKNCAAHSFENDNSKIQREYYLWNVTGAEKYLGQGNQSLLDIDNFLKNNSPFIEFGNDEIILNKQVYTCTTKSIQNCLLQDSRKCLFCELGYELTSNDSCIPKPNAPIINCETQLTELKCLKCKNGFYNTNENLFFCKESTYKPNCLKYKSKSDGCIECSEGFTAVKGECSPRVYQNIENCEILKGEGEGCQQCKNGYIESSDGLGCLEKIPKCKIHKKGMNGLKGRLGLGCYMCEEGYFVDPEVGHVGSLGTVTEVKTPSDSENNNQESANRILEFDNLNLMNRKRVLQENEDTLKVLNTYVSINSCKELHAQAEKECEIYSKQGVIKGNEEIATHALQLCQKCINGYFLTLDVQKNPCKAYYKQAFEGCAQFSGFLERKCLWCDYQSILMKTQDLCLPPIKASDCIEYQSPTECKTCKDGFFNETCLKIPDELNCLVIEKNGQGLDLTTVLNARCSKCKEEYWPNLLGKCRTPNDFEKRLCETFSNSGDYFSCTKCKRFSFPIDFQDKSICISKQIPEFVANSVVDADYNSIKAYCRRLKFDPILKKFKCIECVDDRVLDDHTGKCLMPNEVVDIESKKVGFVESYFDMLTTNDLTRRMWMIPEENTFMDNIGNPSTTKFWDPVIFSEVDYSSGLGATRRTFYNKYLKGCKVYVPAMNTSTQIFVCGICKPGFLTINDIYNTHSSSVFKATIYNLVSNNGNIPISPQKSPFTSPVNRNSGVLCLKASDFEIIDDYNMINCERFTEDPGTNKLGCIKCKQGYHGIMDELGQHSPTSKVFYIKRCVEFTSCENQKISGMSYRSDYNIGKLGITLEAFATCGKCQSSSKSLLLRMRYVTETNSIHPSGQDKKSIACQDMSINADLGMANTDYLVTDCNLYIFIDGELNAANRIYCGGCKAGFKAISHWPISDSTNKSKGPSDGFLGRVASCTEILNCDGKDWLNACSKCKIGFSYEYDTTLKVVLYDKCIITPSGVGSCLAANGNRCYLCEEGFVLNEKGVCDYIGVPLCAHFNSNNFIGIGNSDESGAKIESELEYDWSTLQFYMSRGEGCLDCYDDYISMEVPKWGYWEKHIYCAFSGVIKDLEESQGEKVVTGLDYNCSNYGYDYTQSKALCVECKKGFIIGQNGDCDSPRDSLKGCAKNVSKGSDICIECQLDYHLYNNKCFLKNVDDCIEYYVNEQNELICKKCRDEKYLSTNENKCISGEVKGCLEYQNNNSLGCLKCDDGDALLTSNIELLAKDFSFWNLMGRVWRSKQPFWDFWVHLFFERTQSLSLSRHTACVQVKDIKCKKIKVLRVEKMNPIEELFGFSKNKRFIDGFESLFVERAFKNQGRSLLGREEIVFECEECNEGRFKTTTLETNVFSAYSLIESEVWAKGYGPSAKLSEIEQIAVRIDEKKMNRMCSEIKKKKDCLIQDSGAIANLGEVFINYSGALNIFGEEFLERLQNGESIWKLLNMFEAQDIKYPIVDSPNYVVTLTDLSNSVPWLKDSSLNIYADFHIFIAFSNELKSELLKNQIEGVFGLTLTLQRESYSVYKGDNKNSRLAKSDSFSFFRSRPSRSQFRCLICNDGFYSENGICKSRKITVQNCYQLEPDSDGKCLTCEDNFFLSTDKKCTFLSKTVIDNCLEYESQSKCRVCRYGYLPNENSGNCNPIEQKDLVPGCLRQTSAHDCVECVFGSRFNWRKTCDKMYGSGFCWNFGIDDLDGCLSCQPFTFLIKGSDTKNFCSPFDLDSFLGSDGYNSKISNFLENHVQNGFLLNEYILRKNGENTLEEQYKLTENQNKDITEIESDKDNCILFDPYTPFNCISCRSGFAINTLTNKCELVVQKIEFCEEYISIDKPICIRCKTGYVLDYGININLFNENTVLKEKPICEPISKFNQITLVDPNCSNSIIHNEYRCIQCLKGYYLDLDIGSCKKCSEANCATCSLKEPHRCLICMSGFHNDKNGKCISD